MSIDRLEQLNENHLDVLREIGNIGCGNAATALASMINNNIDISVPVVRIMDIGSAVESLGGAENVVIGILCSLKEDVEGYMLLTLKPEFAEMIIKVLLGEENVDLSNLNDMEKSSLGEIGNILIASYINSVASISNMTIDIGVPGVSVDMVGAMLGVMAIEMGTVSDDIIFIEDDFSTDENKFTANMMLLPDIESLNKLMHGLGIDYE